MLETGCLRDRERCGNAEQLFKQRAAKIRLDNIIALVRLGPDRRCSVRAVKIGVQPIAQLLEVVVVVVGKERLLGDLPELSVIILDLARERGRVTVAEIAMDAETSRNTVKSHLKALTAAGHLVRHGAGRGTWYALA